MAIPTLGTEVTTDLMVEADAPDYLDTPTST